MATEPTGVALAPPSSETAEKSSQALSGKHVSAGVKTPNRSKENHEKLSAKENTQIPSAEELAKQAELGSQRDELEQAELKANGTNGEKNGAGKQGLNLAKYFNYGQIGFNGLSVLANLFHFVFGTENKDKIENKIHASATWLGEMATKAFYFVNGAQNAIDRFIAKDYLTGLGYANDIPIGALAKQKNVFLLRSLSAGWYSLLIGLKDAIDSASDESFAVFKSWKHHFDSVWKGLKISAGNCLKGPGHFWEKLTDTKSGLLSVIGGFTMLASLPTWLIFGRYAAGWVRHIGGGMQDIAQIKPGYMLTDEELGKKLPRSEQANIALKRALDYFLRKDRKTKAPSPKYFLSGIGVTLGTFCDWMRNNLEKIGAPQPLIQIFTSLTFVTDGYGIYQLGRAQMTEVGDRGQIGQQAAENKAKSEAESLVKEKESVTQS